ncbi:MAG TPA: lipopolysaccharide heptosyltransferase I [Thermoanaerobaculales bacterium]|mgnify:FL=1|nr:lipopolysaccharide heptosyltransferase I [Thermoanaerobaculales bacterium]
MRIVLVRLSALGDIVHTWPLADALRSARPGVRLCWVVEERLSLLVEGHPAVDQVITVDTRRWRRSPLSRRTRTAIHDLRRRFAELSPDLALDPQGVVKSALVTRWTGAAQRVGLALPWRRERLAALAYTTTLPGSRERRHVVASNLELLRAVGATPPAALPHPDGRWLVERTRRQPLPAASPPGYVVLLPGAGRARKLLPVEGLAEVARRAAGAGHAALVVWGPGEEERASEVVTRAGPGAAMAPPTDLAGLVQLLAQARAVVGGDTGPVHLAASFGVPALAIFTATDWRRNGPLGRRVEVVSGARDGGDRPRGTSRAARPGPVTPAEMADGFERLLGAP